MSISTYAELQTAIADFLNRSDLTSIIPTFIDLAESKIAQDLRHRNQEKRATAPLNERFEILPPDFLEMRRLTLSDGTQIRPMSGDWIAEQRERYNDTAGKPKYYYMTANEIEFYPTPDDTYTMTMLYYARIPALSESETSNWVLINFPDVYLYGALYHSAGYLKDDERMKFWAGLYGKAIADLNRNSQRTQYSGGALVMRNRNG